MNRVPKRILTAIERSRKYNAIATKCDEEIRQWLYNNNALNDTMVDQLIDITEQGQASAEELYKFFEENLEHAQEEGNTYDI